MTDAELDEIEKRAKAATPGPWDGGFKPGGVRVDATNAPGMLGMPPTVAKLSGSFQVQQEEANADFIAAAREDVPKLVAELRLAKRAIAACVEYFDALAEWSDENQSDHETHRIPAGSQPRLDEALEKALVLTATVR
jgi:hypothetical protein